MAGNRMPNLRTVDAAQWELSTPVINGVKITGVAKKIYVWLMTYALDSSKKGVTRHITAKEISNGTGVSAKSAYNGVKQLERAGIVTVHQHGKTGRILEMK